MSVEEVRKIAHSTDFASGNITLNAQNVVSTAYRVGAIHTSTSKDRENVKISAEGNDGTFVITQKGEDGIFHGKFVDNTSGDKALTMSVVKYGDHLLTLANDNTTTGTLTIEDGTVQIGTGTGSQGDWAGRILLSNENSELVYSYGAGETKVLSDTMQIKGKGTVKIASGNVQFENDKSFYPDAIRISIENNAEMTTNFSSAKTGQIESDISGAGKLSVKGGGVLLGGNNTFSGGTSILGGTEANGGATRVVAMTKTAFGNGSVTLNGKSDILVESTAGGLTIADGQTISVANDWTGTITLNGITLGNVIRNSDEAAAYISGNVENGTVLNLENSSTGTLVFDLTGISSEELIANANSNNIVGIYISFANLGLANWNDLQSVVCAGDGAFTRGKDEIIGYAGTTEILGGDYTHIYDATNGILYVAIPEPSTFSLFAGGLMLAFAVSRRRRRNKTR